MHHFGIQRSKKVKYPNWNFPEKLRYHCQKWLFQGMFLLSLCRWISTRNLCLGLSKIHYVGTLGVATFLHLSAIIKKIMLTKYCIASNFWGRYFHEFHDLTFHHKNFY